jgi:hypothetical protein
MIKAIVADIGGPFEAEPLGRDPTARFPKMIASWEMRLHVPPGEIHARIKDMNRSFDAAGKDGELGTLSQKEWQDCVRRSKMGSVPDLVHQGGTLSSSSL